MTDKQNVRAGFRATGIHPIDRQQVLKRLPKAENPEEGNSNGEVNECIIGLLKSIRGETDRPRGRKRRIPTEPGKSISLSEIENEVVDIDSEHENQDTDPEDETLGEIPQSSQVTNEQSDIPVPVPGITPGEMPKRSQEPTSMLTPDRCKLRIGSLVCVDFGRKFLGRIDDRCDENEFLRFSIQTGDKAVFSWPEEEDSSLFCFGQIKFIVPQGNISINRRNQILIDGLQGNKM